MYDRFDHGGNDSWSWLFMILIMSLVIIGIVLAVRHLSGPSSTTRQDTALDVLKTRYAKGELDKKEFEEKRKDLKL